ncbi:putative ATP binding protein [Aureobasidium melanogenum CBS 110374]|uniref:GPN-loop GTPase 2 n=1 Tax=Aureobasidium melanogenum (strain CBS 110374) TaxID=1043003 RepID=A0A074VGR0_AURM1|nr:putative ATP binding protein [Aureobasidium melanogenum CBS 110374]KEQ59653.1 putative ATP binding protein [Aureobasidium melanogenum CBS 110374]
MPFAQLVIGPPGAGKSTYCDGMHQFLTAIDRKCAVVNLDPANDKTSYPCALDIRDLVSLEEVMEQEELGPNGGVMYALEELQENFDWLQEGLKELNDSYILFDCPGQVELFTHHNTMPKLFHRLEKIGYRLIVVHLLDSLTLSRPTLYVSSLLLCLRSMLHLPFPLVNVLTKIDNLAKNSEPLPFNLDYYTEVQDLDYLLPHLEAEQNNTSSKFTALNEALIQLIGDFGLVAFETLAVEDKVSMTNLLHAIDRASGYVFGTDKGTNDSVWQVAMQEGWGGKIDVRDVQERWIDRRDEFDEMERQQIEDQKAEEARQAGQPEVRRVPAQEPSSGQDTQVSGDDLDDDEDLEAMQAAFLNKQSTGNDNGIRIIRKN